MTFRIRRPRSKHCSGTFWMYEFGQVIFLRLGSSCKIEIEIPTLQGNWWAWNSKQQTNCSSSQGLLVAKNRNKLEPALLKKGWLHFSNQEFWGSSIIMSVGGPPGNKSRGMWEARDQVRSFFCLSLAQSLLSATLWIPISFSSLCGFTFLFLWSTWDVVTSPLLKWVPNLCGSAAWPT